MAYLTQIDTQTSTDVNLATVLLVSTFTNTTRIREVFVNVFADQLAGGGAYICTVKVQRAGAGTAYTIKSESRTLSAETEVGFAFGPITINATDVLTVYLLGQAGDTTTPDVIVDVNEELPTELSTVATEAYAADGAAATPVQLLYMIWAMLAEANASGTTITVKKIDGSTTAMTFTIDSATAPATITRAS